MKMVRNIFINIFNKISAQFKIGFSCPNCHCFEAVDSSKCGHCWAKI
jgi:hypothetical protein